MNKRTKSITLRVTDSEKTQLEKNAKKYGLSMSGYLRCAGLLIENECSGNANNIEEETA